MASSTIPPSSGLDDLARLRRSLCTIDEVNSSVSQCVSRLIDNGRGEEVVRALIDHSSSGNHATGKKLVVGVLALCTTKDLKTKQAAYEALNDICNTPPLLFQFLTCVAKQTTKGKSGFGRAKRKAIARWYNSKSVKELAVFVTRYRKRSTWSHVDLVRLAHTKPGNAGVDFILKYVTKGLAAAKQHLESETTAKEVPDSVTDVVKYLEAIETVKHSHDEHEVARLVEEHKLMREHVPTWFIKSSKEVWCALIPHMPLSTVLFHLNKMASIGLLNSGPDGFAQILIQHLESDSLLKEQWIHPFSIQMSLKSYEGGKAGRSFCTWMPNAEISQALQSVFYKAIALYQPTGGRYAVAIDVSSSMFNNMHGAPMLMASIWAAASMALPILRKENDRHLLAVAGTAAVPVDVTRRDLTVENVCEALERQRKDGSSNVSLAVGWALDKRESVDAFVVFSDQIHVNGKRLIEAFRNYRRDLNLPSSRLVIVSYSRFADQTDTDDAGILLLRGLDPAMPEIIRNFVAGKLD